VDDERLLVDQADLDRLLVRLRDLGEERAAGHRNDRVTRETPAELLDNFEACVFEPSA